MPTKPVIEFSPWGSIRAVASNDYFVVSPAVIAVLFAILGCGTGCKSGQDKRFLSDTVPIQHGPNARVALGAKLFEDVRLSLDSTISCSTCHMPRHAFAEPRGLSRGIGIRARRRNAPSLVNVSVARTSFDWDGRASTLQDQLRGVFAVTGDMGISLADAVARVRTDSEYRDAFVHTFGRPPDTAGFLSAITEFQRTLVVGESRFDRFYLKSDSLSLSTSEQRGWVLFRRAGCAGCHVPLPDPGGVPVIVFSDGRFHNLGVGFVKGEMTDLGRYEVTHAPTDWGGFRTPQLNNVALTAPYMHDGSIGSLEAVIDFYAEGGIPNPGLDPVIGRRNLTSRDRADLVAFLRALTTEWVADPVEVNRRLMHGMGRSTSTR